jgi:hypothetical protein
MPLLKNKIITDFKKAGTLQSLLFSAASLKNSSLQRIQTPVRHTTAEVVFNNVPDGG